MSPYRIVVLFIFASVVGIILLPKFAVNFEPDYALPTLSVSFYLRNSSPEIVEHEATSPLENALAQISNIKGIYSVSRYNTGEIELTFDKNSNIEFKYFEVISTIRHIYPKLNQNITYPHVENKTREMVGNRALLLYRINAHEPSYQIQQSVKDVFLRELSQMKGVKDVQVTGAQNLQITVQYNLEKLRRHGISPHIIMEEISKAFTSSFPGTIILGSGQELKVKVEIPFNDIRLLRTLKIPTISGSQELGHLAEIRLEESAPQQYFRINGKNAVSLSIYADNKVNKIELATLTKKRVQQAIRHLPANYEIKLDHDDTEFLVQEIHNNYIRGSLSLLVLLVFVACTFRKWKHILILFTGIITNICLTILLAFTLKITIHLYTIAGLFISFGIIIDNAIIMLDHLERKNNRNIFKAILGANIITIYSLTLIYFLPTEGWQTLTQFSLIVSLSLACSIIISTFFIPSMYQLLYSNAKQQHKTVMARQGKKLRIYRLYHNTIIFISKRKKITMCLLILSFGLPVFMLPAKWEGQEWYNKTIGSNLYQQDIRLYSDKMLGGCLRLFLYNVYEQSGYRNPEKTRLHVNASLPYGNTIEHMDLILRKMEAQLQYMTGIEKYITEISSAQNGGIIILFKPTHENGNLPYQLKMALIAQSLKWSGIEWNIYGVGNGFYKGFGEPLPNFKIKLTGYDYADLENYGDELAEELLRHDRVQKVNKNERLGWNEKAANQLVLDLNLDNLAALSILPSHIASGLKEKAEALEPNTTVIFNQKSIPVYLIPNQAEDFSSYEVRQHYLVSEKKRFNLDGNARVMQERTADAIHKEDRQYIRLVGFDYYGTSQFGHKYLNQVLGNVRPKLPQGYTAEEVNLAFSLDFTKRNYGLLLLLMLSIFVVSSILFESFKFSLYIICAIPISFIGLFLSFYWSDSYFDQGGYAAFILLSGLAVNAAIFIINDINQIPRMKKNRSIIKAVFRRLESITLTVLSTCLGLVPFLVGNGNNEIFWSPLAVGTIGGLLASFIFSLFILPSFLISRKK